MATRVACFDKEASKAPALKYFRGSRSLFLKLLK